MKHLSETRTAASPLPGKPGKATRKQANAKLKPGYTTVLDLLSLVCSVQAQMAFFRSRLPCGLKSRLYSLIERISVSGKPFETGEPNGVGQVGWNLSNPIPNLSMLHPRTGSHSNSACFPVTAAKASPYRPLLFRKHSVLRSLVSTTNASLFGGFL